MFQMTVLRDGRANSLVLMTMLNLLMLDWTSRWTVWERTERCVRSRQRARSQVTLSRGQRSPVAR